jgi:hypothetical protein
MTLKHLIPQSPSWVHTIKEKQILTSVKKQYQKGLLPWREEDYGDKAGPFLQGEEGGLLQYDKTPTTSVLNQIAPKKSFAFTELSKQV